MSLFNRIVDIELAGITGLRSGRNQLKVAFTVTKTLDVSSNTADLRIWNLSENTRNNIRELDDVVTINAGYIDSDGPRLLFIGEVVRINHTITPPDVVSVIEAGDGIKSLRESRDILSFAEGTDASQVLNDAANRLGISLKDAPPEISSEYLHGFSHIGSVKDALNRITDRLGLEWSIQNNEVQILEKRKVLPGVPIVVNFQDGLIESPERLTDLRSNLIEEQPNPGFKVRTLLNPDIEPGRPVILEAIPSPGEYRVERVTHRGDNFTDQFISEFEVTEV